MTADGQHLVVQMDRSFTVTGTQQGGGRGDCGLGRAAGSTGSEAQSS